MQALGFIETKGLLTAITAADAMLKAAGVRLVEKNVIGGGLVNITVAGEVAAVRAAVDAGVAVCSSTGESLLISSHVIARPDSELSKVATVAVSSVFPENLAKRQKKALAEAEEKSTLSEPIQYSASQLKRMTVSRLRQIAQTTPEFPLDGEEFITATKKSLIDAIIHTYRQRKE